MTLDRTITDANKDRAAKIAQAKPGAPIWVYFGWNEGGGFRVSHANPSKTYATVATAERAAARWVAAH